MQRNLSFKLWSVQVSTLMDLVVGQTWGMIQQRSSSSLFCRRPLWALLAWTRMSTLWCCPSSISSADHGVTHPPRCPEGWFWRGCHGLLHARTVQVSVSWQLPEKVHVDLQGSWCWCSNLQFSSVQSLDRLGRREGREGDMIAFQRRGQTTVNRSEVSL